MRHAALLDGTASISALPSLTVSAEVVADDPDSGIYDHETKAMRYVFRLAGTVERFVDLTAEVTISYDQDDPEQATVESLDFEDESVELFVGERELQRVDDNDPDDNEMGYRQHPHESEMGE